MTDALLDQNADSLVPVVYSVESPTRSYLDRGFSVIQFLNSVFNDYSMNLRMQVLSRVGAFSIVSLWLVWKVSQLFSTARSGIILVGLGVLFVFVLDYPTVGESVIHGSNSSMLAALALIGWARAASSASDQDTNSLVGRVFYAAAAVVFAVIAVWTWVLSVIWSPLFVGLTLIPSLRPSGPSIVDFTRNLVRRIWIPVVSLGTAFVLYVLAAPSLPEGGENYSVRRAARGSLYAATIWEPENRFVVKWVLIAVVLTIVTLALAIVIRRSGHGFWTVTVAAGLGLSASLSAIFVAGFSHIEANRFHPRYFGASLLIGALCTSTVFAGLISRWLTALSPLGRSSLEDVTLLAVKKFASPVEIACVFLCLVLGVRFVTSPVGFGLESSKAHEVEIVGNPLSTGALGQVEEISGTRIQFVMGNHWDVWPTLFVAGEHQNRKLVALSHFDVGSGRIAALLRQERTYGVCLDARFEQCRQFADAVFASMDLDKEVQLKQILSLAPEGRMVHLVSVDGVRN